MTMMENKIGRPSKAQERSYEILQAAVSVVAKEGLEGITFAKVAEASGMQRTLVHHYFSSRSDFMNAFIEHYISKMGTEIIHRFSGKPLSERIIMMFTPEVYRTQDDLIVWFELVAQSARNPFIQQMLHTLWTKHWLPDFENQLAQEYPKATPEAISSATYVIVCLFEAYWAFSIQGVTDQQRQKQMEQTVLMILNGLS
ncbi:TetR/AcrR family transcriptional regulator [Acinetobacter baumannii]|uniref:TetR/AcrR family transcriptional regulator n=1 Tax=Acinetobacter baumannii TaxID=470 RepID=UPI00112AB6D4|nr:TetR/AcrR family transcriptional regulator [Acinetobacter baumannii]TPT51967.1 TetR/AcrR family transcriptional regulator [Acinetobacter baumannii]